jgi:Cu2+-exporting ATPase
MAYSGQDFFVGAWRDLRGGRLGMDVPIVLGLVAAWGGSAVATVWQVGDFYADSVTMFVLLVLLARRYEMRGREIAASTMDRLARVMPQVTRRLRPDGDEEEVAAVDLRPGDLLRVAPGEALPADGVVREGESSFDESVLTGEPVPVSKGPGAVVTAGTCNRDQPVVVEVTRVGESSTTGEVRRLLDQGLRTRPRYAELAERVSEWFVAVVLVVAGATALVWLWLDPSRALAHTVSVLIVTCPCALALATPVAVAVATGRFALAGILPLRLSALESLATADLAVFDKTGTLTLGDLEVASVRLVGRLDREAAVSLAASLEVGSGHPVGRALRRLRPGAPPLAVSGQRYEPGAGVEGVVGDERWWLGRPAYVVAGLGAQGLPEAAQRLMEELEEDGQRVVLLADATGVQAAFGLRDRPRAGGEAMLADLRRAGFGGFAVLSGDATGRTRRFADALGIEEAHGDQTPADKLAWIQLRQREGRRVLMVGDGINDAPTLAAADVSMSFGDATDLAQRSSDFVVLAHDLSAVATARRLAARTRNVIRQNLAWAAAYNLLSVPAAALGMVPPWAAALGMSASSLLVVLNALRLSRPRDRHGADGSRGAQPSPALAG